MKRLQRSLVIGLSVVALLGVQTVSGPVMAASSAQLGAKATTQKTSLREAVQSDRGLRRGFLVRPGIRAQVVEIKESTARVRVSGSDQFGKVDATITVILDPSTGVSASWIKDLIEVGIALLKGIRSKPDSTVGGSGTQPPGGCTIVINVPGNVNGDININAPVTNNCKP